MKYKFPAKKLSFLFLCFFILYWALSQQLYKPIKVGANLYSSVSSYVNFFSEEAVFLGDLDTLIRLMPDIVQTKDKYFNNVELINSAMNLVNAQTYNCEYTANQNIVHAITQTIFPRLYESYGILDWRFFQCGFCHQRNLLLLRILESAGYNVALKALNGHVVAEVTLLDTKYFVDADYGINLTKFPENEIEIQEVIEAYKPIVGPGVEIQLIEDAFSSSYDDAYYDLNELGNLENKQRLMMNLVGNGVSLVLTILIIVIGNLVVVLRRNRKRDWVDN